MNWSLIEKKAKPSLEGRRYRDPKIKEFLRREGRLRCVYCAVHENALGGLQAFHVEHYRPRSKFPALENSLSNLFYACPICNRFKSNDWPAEPLPSFRNASYPDPSKVDYSILFRTNEKNGFISGVFVASKYVVERLYFNRPQLILERKECFLKEELGVLLDSYESLNEKLFIERDSKSISYIKKLAKISTRLNKLLIDRQNIPNYESSDVCRD